EGDQVRLTGQVLDPGSLDDQTIVITWGDGLAPITSVVKLQPGQTSFEAVRVYADDTGPGASTGYSIGVQAIDKAGATAATSTSLTVTNGAPKVSYAGTGASTPTAVELQALVSDPGALDTFTYAWTVSPGGQTGSGSTFSFPATALGAYNVSLTVTDKDGGA